MIRFDPPGPDDRRRAVPMPIEACDPVIIAHNRRWSRLADAIANHPLAAVTAVTTVIAILLLGVPICADVSWQLWIAHHIRTGARLYVDIVEVNPPLWFWMAIPVDAVAGVLGIEPGRILLPTLALATIASLAATERLIRHVPAGRRTALLVYAALALLILPTWMTGQREQIVLIASLPYIALAAARREARTVSPWLAIGIGAAAALGFALKHYFLIVPLLLELWLIWARGRDWRALRPETALVLLVGVAYAVAIAVVTPDFVTAMIPLLRLSYGTTGIKSITDLLEPVQYIWIGSLAVVAIHHRSLGRATPFTVALLIATAGFGAAWAIQHKGWPYQAIATSGCLAIALAALLAETGRRPTPLLPAMLIAPILFGWHGDVSADSFYRMALAPLAAETRAGDTVGIISTSPGVSWPLISEKRLRSPSRYYGYWMLDSVVRNERHGHDPRVAAFGRAAVLDTVIDYRCMPPSRIVFSHWPTGTAFDIHAFFLREPAFRAMMTHYRRERWSHGMDVFRQVSPLPPMPAAACRRGV